MSQWCDILTLLAMQNSPRRHEPRLRDRSPYHPWRGYEHDGRPILLSLYV